jgi:hypothetical protein
LRADEAPEWWHRLEIVEEPGSEQALRFVYPPTKRAPNKHWPPVSCRWPTAFMQAWPAATPDSNAEVAKTLFELLLPLRNARGFSRNKAIWSCMVDKRSARYPWELLENRWGISDRPPSVCAGMIRQFKHRRLPAAPGLRRQQHGTDHRQPRSRPAR